MLNAIKEPCAASWGLLVFFDTWTKQLSHAKAMCKKCELRKQACEITTKNDISVSYFTHGIRLGRLLPNSPWLIAQQ